MLMYLQRFKQKDLQIHESNEFLSIRTQIIWKIILRTDFSEEVKRVSVTADALMRSQG